MTEAVFHPEGRLRFQGVDYRAAHGRSGITSEKREGDGATPLALLPLRRVFYRADRIARPRAAVPVEPLAPHDGWCDDSNHRDYNRKIRLPHEARHEELWRADGLYDLIGELGWNDQPIERGRGSAIFLHVATPDYAPTAGCIALSLRDLTEVLRQGVTGIRVRQG